MPDDGPQLEDGYTRFANEWLEALVLAAYPGSLKTFVLAIARETWGWGAGGEDNPFRAIPGKRLAELLGVGVRQVQKLRQQAVQHNLIEIEPGDHSDTCSYRVQKRYMDWILWQKKGTWDYEPRTAQRLTQGAAPDDGRGRSEERRAQDSEQRRASSITTKKGTYKEKGKKDVPAPSPEDRYTSGSELPDDLPALKQNFPLLSAATWGLSNWPVKFRERLFTLVVTACEEEGGPIRDEDHACELLGQHPPQAAEQNLPAKWIERATKPIRDKERQREREQERQQTGGKERRILPPDEELTEEQEQRADDRQAAVSAWVKGGMQGEPPGEADREGR